MILSKETQRFFKSICIKHDYCEQCGLWIDNARKCGAVCKAGDELIPCYFDVDVEEE